MSKPAVLVMRTLVTPETMSGPGPRPELPHDPTRTIVASTPTSRAISAQRRTTIGGNGVLRESLGLTAPPRGTLPTA